MPKPKQIKNSTSLSKYVAELMLRKKADDIKILDLTELTSVTDYFVICTANSDVQIKAIADYIYEETKKTDNKPWHSEGYGNLSWVLLDFVDVVAHIFMPETRRFYNLESLWGDAKISEIKDEK